MKINRGSLVLLTMILVAGGIPLFLLSVFVEKESELIPKEE